MTLEFEPPLTDDTPKINVGLVGPPKTGKSAGAASAPGPVLYLNAELATRLRFARRKYGDKLAVVQVVGERTLIDAMYAVHSGDYATVVVDSIGELRALLLSEASSSNGGKMKHKPTLDQYREVQDTIERFCRALCKADVNVVFVFHSEPMKDEVTGQVTQEPTTGSSKPKLGRTLLGMVDIVGFTGVIESEDGPPEYVALLRPTEGRQAGDGFDCLANEQGWRELDLSEWAEAIKQYEATTTTEEHA